MSCDIYAVYILGCNIFFINKNVRWLLPPYLKKIWNYKITTKLEIKLICSDRKNTKLINRAVTNPNQVHSIIVDINILIKKIDTTVTNPNQARSIILSSPKLRWCVLPSCMQPSCLLLVSSSIIIYQQYMYRSRFCMCTAF